MSNSPLDLHAVLQERLEVGETLAWSGSPDERKATWSAAPISLLGAIALATVGWWLHLTIGAFASPSAPAPTQAAGFILLGCPVAVLALVLCCWPLTSVTRARRTLYAITNHRVLILRGPGEGGFESYAASDIADVQVRGHVNSPRDVVFAHAGQTLTSGLRLTRAIGFSWLIDADIAAEHLRKLRQNQA